MHTQCTLNRSDSKKRDAFFYSIINVKCQNLIMRRYWRVWVLFCSFNNSQPRDKIFLRLLFYSISSGFTDESAPFLPKPSNAASAFRLVFRSFATAVDGNASQSFGVLLFYVTDFPIKYRFDVHHSASCKMLSS